MILVGHTEEVGNASCYRRQHSFLSYFKAILFAYIFTYWAWLDGAEVREVPGSSPTQDLLFNHVHVTS